MPIETPYKITDTATWGVLYNDDTRLWECNSEGFVVNKYDDIERSKLSEFNVYLTDQIFSCREFEKRLDALMPEPDFVEYFNVNYNLFARWLHRKAGSVVNWRKVDIGYYLKRFGDLRKKDERAFAKAVEQAAKDWREEEKLVDCLFALLKPTVKLGMKDGYRLIWRRRRLQKVVGPQVPFATIYLIGWQVTLNGRNIKNILYLYPDGTVELNDDKSNLELLKFEKEGLL